MENRARSETTYLYRSPRIYVGLFYFLLMAWTVVSVLYMGTKGWVSWAQLLMVAFVLVMTWYFSVGISYKMKINDGGALELFSFRRVIRARSTEIAMVEGPRLPIGFIRFRLEREKAYLFGIPGNSELQQVLSVVRKTNPDIMFKNLRLNP